MITATAIEFQTARATTLGLQRALNRGRLRQSQREVSMRQPERGRVRRPRADDRLMRDVLFGISGYAAVLVAHDLKLYPLLAAQPRTLPEVGDALHIAPRAAEALVSISTALGLVEERDGWYSLRPVAEDYLLEGSATYFGGYFDMMIQNYSMYSFESLRRAVLTNTPQFYGGDDLFTSHRNRADRVRTYTRAMHSASMAAALAGRSGLTFPAIG